MVLEIVVAVVVVAAAEMAEVAVKKIRSNIFIIVAKMSVSDKWEMVEHTTCCKICLG